MAIELATYDLPKILVDRIFSLHYTCIHALAVYMTDLPWFYSLKLDPVSRKFNCAEIIVCINLNFIPQARNNQFYCLYPDLCKNVHLKDFNG